MPEKEEKTEAPTQKRLDEIKNKGQRPKSQDFNSGVLLFVSVLCIFVFGERMVRILKENLIDVFYKISTFTVTEDNLITILTDNMVKVVVVSIYPILIIILVMGIVANVIQVGVNFTTKPLEPKFDKVFKMSGLKKLVSPTTFIELGKNLSKIIIVGYVAYWIISGEYENLMYLIDASVGSIMHAILSIGFEISLYVSVLLIILGILDLIYQKRKHYNDIKMTKQEVKDEVKSQEGDVKSKNKMKQMMAEMIRKSMMGEVPKATVVITNPTFIAIAIKYDRDFDKAPVVLAKGKRAIADEIRKIARDNDIPIVENKPLARGMYDLVEPGFEIPIEFFESVAEVLAYVYSLKGNEQYADA